jgi:hypothetical protein
MDDTDRLVLRSRGDRKVPDERLNVLVPPSGPEERTPRMETGYV